MLRGNYSATVDEKGRVKIPADFLAELRKGGNKFYVTSETGDRAQIYPMKVWLEIERKLAKLGSHNRAKQKFLARTNYYGQVVEVDGQGQLTYLEVWNHARFLEQLNRNPITAEDEKTLDELGI